MSDLGSIVASLRTLSEQELVTLNRVVIAQIKANRSVAARMIGATLSVGDRVETSTNLRRVGGQCGTVTKVNRQRGVVRFDDGQVFTVPLNCLSVIS